MSDHPKHRVLVTEEPATDGMEIVMKAGPERRPIVFDQDPAIVDWIVKPRRWWYLWEWLAYRKYACGHYASSAFAVRIYGREFRPNRRSVGLLCPACGLEDLKRTTIRCCLCGIAIIPGDTVAFYDLGTVEPKDYEVTIIDESYVVGCMQWDCAPSGLSFVGHWNGQGVDYYDFSRSD